MKEEILFFKTGRLAVLLVVIFNLIIAGCSSSKPETENQNVGKKESITIYKDLSSKYSQLFRQNLELKKMVAQFESDKQAEREKNDKTVKHLSNTIHLLELNLKQLQDQLSANSELLNQLSASKIEPPEPQAHSEQKRQPTTQAENDKRSVLIEDFQTPDSSNAINTIVSLPKQALDIDTPNPQEAEKALPDEKKPVTDITSSYDFLSVQSDSAWQDPDLDSPTSPIKLKVIPGAKRSYQEAFSTFSNREFQLAIKLFSDFIKRYPNDFDADNSQYWIGLSYYHLENFANAEKAFRKVLRNYPHEETKKGYKTPDAILMLGRIYTLQKQPIKGRYYFKEVIKRFPDSLSAAKAKSEIQSMSGF